MGWTYKRGKKWYYGYYDVNGDLIRKVGGNTKREAERILRIKEAEKYSKKSGVPILTSITVNELWNNFSEAKKDTVRPRTWEVWKPRLRFWKKEHLNRSKTFKPFSFPEIEKIKNMELKSKYSNKTVNDYMSVIKRLYEYARKMNVIEYNPVNDLDRLKEEPEKSTRALTEEEFEKILEHSNDFYKDLFIFLTYTGLRRNEARFLKWEDIDLNREEIKIGFSKNFTTKTGKPRVLPIHKEVKKVLKKRKRGSGLVWESPNGGTFGRNVWRRVLLQTAKRANVKDITLHTFRHTFGTWLANRGANPYYVMHLMGHQNLDTTMKYFHPELKYASEAINKLSERKKT